MSTHFLHALTGQYKINEALGEGSVTYVSAANCITPEIVIFGKCELSGTPSPEAPVAIACNNNSYDIGGTVVNAPELYGVGSIRDEYYPLTGKIVRRCKSIEFNETTSFRLYNGGASYVAQGISFTWDNAAAGIGYQSSVCSHFINKNGAWAESYADKYGIYGDHPNIDTRYFRAPNEGITTVDEFKAWCAAQSAAGTPVTLVYQLANPIVEYVAPIKLASKRGANTISEKGSMTGTEIGVKYLTHS